MKNNKKTLKLLIRKLHAKTFYAQLYFLRSFTSVESLLLFQKLTFMIISTEAEFFNQTPESGL